MKYEKPLLIANQKNLPPVTVNFAPPAVETGTRGKKGKKKKVIK